MFSPTMYDIPTYTIDKSNFLPLNPQQQQVWDVGSQRLITLRARPYFSASVALS